MKKLSLFSAVLALAVSLISPAFTASAASKFDDVIKQGTLVFTPGSHKYYNCSQTRDLTKTYISFARKAVADGHAEYRDKLNDFLDKFEVARVNSDYYYAIVNAGYGVYLVYMPKSQYNRTVWTIDSVEFGAKSSAVVGVGFSFNGCDSTSPPTPPSSNWQFIYNKHHYNGIVATNFPMNYPEGYAGYKPAHDITSPSQFEEYKPPEYLQCNAVDVACYLGNLFKFIVAFPSMIVDAIKYLFLPDFSKIGSSIASMYDSVTKGLGFLWFPFDFAIKLFGALAPSLQIDTLCAWSSQSGWSINNLPDSRTNSTYSLVGNAGFFGSNFKPFSSLCYVEREYPVLLKLVRSVLQLIIALSIYFATRRKLFEFLRGELT